MNADKPMRKKRGFVLIVALMLAVATAAVAIGLIQTSGSANIGVAHTNAGEIARSLAEAGLARAESYALTISKTRNDFDRVLDPGNSTGVVEANCSQLDQVTDSGAVAETGNMYLPKFTDGTIEPNYQGLRWMTVPYNGGAYLVRFSDNFDDGIAAPGPFPDAIDWVASTSNTKSGSPGDNTWCGEGPTAPTAAPTPGINGVNNPARDRDRTIYVTVIGIYPGTDPDTAKHRVVLSKVIMDGRVRGPSALRVGGSIEIDNGSEARFCSEVSGISATGIIDDGPPGSCACGSTSATTVDLSDGSCGACCGSNTYVENDGASQPSPVIPVVRARDWYDYTSSCTFYLDSATMSFFFWDAAGSRNGTACNTHNGNLPSPSANGTTFPDACWVPIWFNTNATPTTAWGPFSYPLGIEAAGANDEIDAGGGCNAAGGANCVVSWRPRNVQVPNVNLGTGGSGYYTGVVTLNVTKPNWATECPKGGAPSDFRWNPPQIDTGSGEEVTCDARATDCDGTHDVWTASEGVSTRWQMAGNFQSMPTGVYFHAGNYNVNADHAVPGAQMPLATNNWPMASLIVEGNVTMTNAKELVLGAGTRKKYFPSLVVSGDLTTANGTQVAFAGSLYVRGSVNWDHGNAGGSYLYGRVEVLGDLETQSGSRVDWNYDVDLFAAGLTRFAREPRLALPLGY